MHQLLHSPPPTRTDIDKIRQKFSAAMRDSTISPAAIQWRMSTFERGLRIADELEIRFGSLVGKRILDVGTAFGGDLVALYARGATCVGSDKFDHRYRQLKGYLGPTDDLHFLQTDCTKTWPFADASFDIVISIAVIEHLDDLNRFFSELIRVLKPDGCALVDTPAALPMVRKDAHYQLPLVGLLPTPWRRYVAEKICKRRYSLQLSDHTFYTANALKRYVRRHGWTIEPGKFQSSPIMARVSHWPLAAFWRTLLRHFAFDFVVIKPENATQA